MWSDINNSWRMNNTKNLDVRKLVRTPHVDKKKKTLKILCYLENKSERETRQKTIYFFMPRFHIYI